MSKPNAIMALPKDERPPPAQPERISAKEYRESGEKPAKRPRHALKAIPGPSHQDIVASLAAKWPALPKICVELPTPPGLNHAYINAVGRGRVKSEATKKFYAEATAVLANLGQRLDAETYRAHIVITRPHPRADIDGRAKLMLDVLVKCGIIPDDRFCEKLVIEWRYRAEPGAVIMLDRYKRRG